MPENRQNVIICVVMNKGAERGSRNPTVFSNGRQPICDKSAILSQVTHQVRHRTLRVKKRCGPDHPAGARDHTTNCFYSKGVDDDSRAIVAGRINQPAPESMRFAVDSVEKG